MLETIAPALMPLPRREVVHPREARRVDDDAGVAGMHEARHLDESLVGLAQRRNGAFNIRGRDANRVIAVETVGHVVRAYEGKGAGESGLPTGHCRRSDDADVARGDAGEWRACRVASVAPNLDALRTENEKIGVERDDAQPTIRPVLGAEKIERVDGHRIEARIEHASVADEEHEITVLASHRDRLWKVGVG